MIVDVGARQSGTMQTTARPTQFGDFPPFPPKTTSNEEAAPVGSGFASNNTPWGRTTIWNNSNNNNAAIGSGLSNGNRGRDSSNAAYASSNADLGAKKGSASLIASSELENWGRSPWGTADPSANAKASLNLPRSSGVSPSRPLNNQQSQPSQPFMDSSQGTMAYFGAPRAGSISHTTSNSIAKPRLNPASSSFSSTTAHAQDAIANGFASFNGFQDYDPGAPRAANQSVSNWPDNNSVHSPTDDRRSVANSEYFVSSSGVPSRSGSLPPSRHGAEPSHVAQNGDTPARFTQMPRGFNPSFSSQPNGRIHQERSGSIHSDSLAMLQSLRLEQDAERAAGQYNPALGVNGSSGYDHVTSLEQNGDIAPSMFRYDENALNGGAAPYATTEGFPSSSVHNDSISSQSQRGLPQFNHRMTPAGSNFRPSPYNSNTATPPAFDHLYPSRSEQHNRTMSTVSSQSAINATSLNRKLQNIHSYQEQQLLATQQARLIAAANQFGAPFNPYLFSGLNMNMNSMHPSLQLAAVSNPYSSFMDVPNGPREQMPTDVRSKVLDDFKTNNKTNRKYELKDIYGYVAEFSGDQHGSRFIQSKLETANSEEKERIFREILPECLQLMQDVFGNYVIQKFFEHGDQTQKKALANKMKGCMYKLSMQMYGCRVVQKALEHILTDQQASLIKELDGESKVLACVKDQNGNHVIQKAIERVPPEHIQFIFKAFVGQIAGLATHSYGCRVIQRMLEHCEPPTKDAVLQELHACGAPLITDSYGNYVIQHVMEHGGIADRAIIYALVMEQLIPYSRHKFASNVVEKCLVYGNDEQRHEIMLRVIEKPERGDSIILTLLKDNYGNYVIQKLLETTNPQDYVLFHGLVLPELTKNKRLIPGKHVQAVEKKMHRFDRFESLSGDNKRGSISSTTANSTDISTAATPPPLTNEEQSPPSTSVPSANISTIEEPLHMAATGVKGSPSLAQGGVAINVIETS